MKLGIFYSYLWEPKLVLHFQIILLHKSSACRTLYKTIFNGFLLVFDDTMSKQENDQNILKAWKFVKESQKQI